MRYITKTDLLVIGLNSGYLLIGIGIMCLIPLIFDLIYFEFDLISFILPGAISICLGFFLTKYLDEYSNKNVRLKHGMIISSLGWIWAALIGGLVFMLATNMPPIDAIFESMSALTGTGVTMYTNLEILPHSILFFRAFEQWIGGLGVVVMVISVLAKPGTATSTLYHSEAHDERIKPSTKATLEKTIEIYIIYTVVGIVLYAIAGMPLFDSLCNTFCIISTGGMNVKNANMGYYHNDLIYFISIVLMILGATSFLVHYKVIKTKGKSLLEDLQFKIIICVIAIVTLMLYYVSNIVPMELLFTVVSAITTTGASISSSLTMASWPSFVIICLICLMLSGGSNGSTVGAIKLIRLITFFKGIYRNIREILSPSGRVVPIKLQGRPLPENASEQSGNYITLYLMFIMFTWALFCFFGHDPFDSLFATVSLQGNNGLDLGIITNQIHPVLKIVSMLNMWIGRLEIYPVLITLRTVFEIFKR
ncbi:MULTISPECIES: TrkH family potassium uptake protein [Methanobrevibacter]|uniref:Trk system potassium uptake protein TrkH n=1 Tax=Methanobrevibacter gottschalkii DSM 11977 TaxID=1122229 RepID=A0A3N5B6H9_9EURY|nr:MULTISPECIES: TrkH family potassium uptake protein [Methanobrevibacter]OEC93851.1 potassium transporter [Methanobrevibacter sp. A27]RPF52689.1 trk system potassium uptake protein TrkH [Methanobrevibacter gottschalkii DSM 11977]